MNSQGAGSQADWTFLSLEDGAVNLASGEIERKGFFFFLEEADKFRFGHVDSEKSRHVSA